MSEAIEIGCPAIDELLGGGLDRGTVTQAYGPPGAGKTNLALSATVSTALGGARALYIDTEGFSADRLDQLIHARVPPEQADAVLDRVLVSSVHDFGDQTEAVREATEVAPDAGLIVLDSATGYYRLERADEPEADAGETLREVAGQVAHLLGLARRHDLAVLITNQVYTDPDDDTMRPLGGYTLAHWCGIIVSMHRFRGDRRKLVLEKHRDRASGGATTVRLTTSGFVDHEDPA